MHIIGSSTIYYRCSNNRKGLCTNRFSFREHDLLSPLKEFLLDSLHTPDVKHARERLTATIDGRTQHIEEDLRRRRALLMDLTKRIQNLVGQLASHPSDSIALALRDLEEEACAERSAIERLCSEVDAPPTVVDDRTLRRFIRGLGDRREDSERGRSLLYRWFAGSAMRLEHRNGEWKITGSLSPMALLLPDARRCTQESTSASLVLYRAVRPARSQPTVAPISRKSGSV